MKWCRAGQDLCCSHRTRQLPSLLKHFSWRDDRRAVNNPARCLKETGPRYYRPMVSYIDLNILIRRFTSTYFQFCAQFRQVKKNQSWKNFNFPTHLDWKTGCVAELVCFRRFKCYLARLFQRLLCCFSLQPRNLASCCTFPFVINRLSWCPVNLYGHVKYGLDFSSSS